MSNITQDDLAALKAGLLEQLKQEIKSEELKQRETLQQKRDEEQKTRQEYIDKMQLSPDPWVDVFGIVQTDAGIKVELEWNDAFVEHLKKNGIKGIDEEQTVQKWIALLLHDMAAELEGDSTDNNSKFA